MLGTLSAANLDTAAAVAIGRPIRTLADAADVAAAARLSQLVIAPDVHDALGLPASIPPAPRDAAPPHPFVSGVDVHPNGLAPFLVVRGRRPSDPSLDVLFPAFDHAAGLEVLPPDVIHAALVRYRELVGVPYRWSPGATGASLILSSRRELVGASTLRPPPPALVPSLEPDFLWWRPLDLDEAGRRYLHAFDANARYLASASSVTLGVGDPIPVASTGARAMRHLPGYWHVDLLPADPRMPDPLDPLGRGVLDNRWITTPTLELAEQLDRVRNLRGAYVWPAAGRILSRWYKTLKAARDTLSDELTAPYGPAALGLVKRTYTMATGNLAGHWREPGDVLHRPDWRHAIMAQSRVNLYRRVERAIVRPVAVEVDAVYVVSDHAEPERAAGGLPLGRELGAFHPSGRWDVAAVADAFAGRRPPFPELRKGAPAWD